jgi:hypothetical protein
VCDTSVQNELEVWALLELNAFVVIMRVASSANCEYLQDFVDEKLLEPRRRPRWLWWAGEYEYEPYKAYLLRDAPTALTFNNCALCPHCIYVFCIYMRTNSDLCHLQHKLIGFYNRDGKCLLRGTDWVIK